MSLLKRSFAVAAVAAGVLAVGAGAAQADNAVDLKPTGAHATDVRPADAPATSVTLGDGHAF